ncbi:MAG: hypothetical protein N2109_12760 [Fimbriimonadales bacterium]|nr:hypothetical protein [Fimbriimonadales bacterium]
MAGSEIWEVGSDGVMRVSLHPGQLAAWESGRRFVLVLSGTQGGKTVFGPLWLWREIRERGPGEYCVVAPTFQLMETKALPEFKRLFGEALGLGSYKASPTRRFEFSEEGSLATFGDARSRCVVRFGYADNPDSLESATYKAVWADEAGQKSFRLESFEALLRRLSIHRGRMLLTTTPYRWNWLKTKLYDRWEAGDPDIDVIRFESRMNPAFSEEEWESAQRMLPKWKFDMMYRALWTKPAGVIYDCFDPRTHCVPSRPIPEGWIRVVGIDFGQVNTAAAFVAVDPRSGRMVVYKTYSAGEKSAEGHVRSILATEPDVPYAVGGSPSEDEWRAKFSRAGLPVSKPSVQDVEAGIDAVYSAFQSGRLSVFSNLEKLIDQLGSYSRELDDDGEPTERIEDKERYHRLDALRYAVSEISTGVFDGPQRVKATGV